MTYQYRDSDFIGIFKSWTSNVCMALVPGSPEIHARSMAQESGENITEALQALDTYKKKDPSKGNDP